MPPQQTLIDNSKLANQIALNCGKNKNGKQATKDMKFNIGEPVFTKSNNTCIALPSAMFIDVIKAVTWQGVFVMIIKVVTGSCIII